MSIKLKSLTIIVFGLLLASCRSRGWIQVTPEISPPASAQGAVAYVASSNTAILFGGATREKWLDETWIWDGKVWHQASPKNSPPARVKQAMEYDIARDKVVLFGGAMDKTLFSDTWEWDGENWKLMNPSHTPPARCCHAMAYDHVSQSVIMYGGYDHNKNIFLSDTWKWNGTDWIEVSCCETPQMSGHAMVSFPAKNEVISIQTSGYGTWSWDGKIWMNLGIENPPHRSEGKAIYDSQNNWVLLFGGAINSQPLNDTWVFDGERWLGLSLSNTPPARYGHVLFYDPNQESIILFGGAGPENTRFGDTWKLKLSNDLSDLVQVATPSATPAQTLPSLPSPTPKVQSGN